MCRTQPTVVGNSSSCGWQPAVMLDVSTLALFANAYAISCGWGGYVQTLAANRGGGDHYG